MFELYRLISSKMCKFLYFFSHIDKDIDMVLEFINQSEHEINSFTFLNPGKGFGLDQSKKIYIVK